MNLGTSRYCIDRLEADAEPPDRGQILCAFGNAADAARKRVNRHLPGIRIDAGQAHTIAEGVMIAPGVDTIDASAIRTDFVGHSYYADSDSVLGVLRDLGDDLARVGRRGDQR